MLPFDSLYYGSTFYVVPSSWWQLLVSRVGQTMVYRQFCIHSSRSAFVFSFSLGAKRSFVACRTQVQYSTMDWRVGTLFEIFNPEKVKKFVNPLFCLYIGYFSLASVGVRSAATHLQTNLYHYLEWKNQQISKYLVEIKKCIYWNPISIQNGEALLTHHKGKWVQLNVQILLQEFLYWSYL